MNYDYKGINEHDTVNARRVKETGEYVNIADLLDRGTATVTAALNVAEEW